jgi:membrane protein YqaA with SNARE-associated domain
MEQAQAGLNTTPEKVTWWHFHRRLYDWVIHFAETPHGERALFLLSFAESSFFPVPPDVLRAPLTLGAPKKWFRFAATCSIASILGGILGYLSACCCGTDGFMGFAHLGTLVLRRKLRHIQNITISTILDRLY